MTRLRRHLCCPLGLLALAAAGCVGGSPGQLPVSRNTPIEVSLLGGEVAAAEAVARGQRPETESKRPALPPDRPALETPQGVTIPTAPEGGGEVAPAALTSDRFHVSVRAWVNGKPIFDEDLLNAVSPEMVRLRGVPEPQYSEKRRAILSEGLQQLIERELILQDADRKLSQNQRLMDKIKELSGKFSERKMQARRKQFPSDQAFQEALKAQGITVAVLRREDEREFLATEYMRSRVGPVVEAISHHDEKEYYQTHLNEFRTVDRVEWQDIFLAVGPKHPTIADARRVAQHLVARLRNGEDFAKLLEHDDGDSRYRGGKGLGERKGEIKPAEIEPYLWNMKDGDIGPLVELPTGIHVFRLVRREHAGQMPFNEQTQKLIRQKMRSEIVRRETRLIVRELTARAVIEVERHPLP